MAPLELVLLELELGLQEEAGGGSCVPPPLEQATVPRISETRAVRLRDEYKVKTSIEMP